MSEQEKLWWTRAIAGAILLLLSTFAVERLEQTWKRWTPPPIAPPIGGFGLIDVELSDGS